MPPIRVTGRPRTTRDKWPEREGHLLTTDYVIDETLTLLRMRLGLDAAESWWNMIAASPRVRKEPIHSFTDCTSFAVMRELRLLQALTTDRHCRQAGFQVAPR